MNPVNDDDDDAVVEILKRKLKVYRENGNDNSASIVQAILRKGTLAVRASAPVVFAKPQGTGAKRKLVDRLTAEELRNRDAKNHKPLNGAELIALMKRKEADPVFAAEVDLELRRPGRHSKARYHIAARAACKEPMLNASPDSIRNGLAYHEPTHKDRLIKGQVYCRLIVKPASRAAAKAEGQSSWVERQWIVYRLKYSRGLVVVTDKGSESRVFPTYGELSSAIKGSGWELVR